MNAYVRVWSKHSNSMGICVFDRVEISSLSIMLDSVEVSKHVGADISLRPPEVWPSTYPLLTWVQFKILFDITAKDVINAFKK